MDSQNGPDQWLATEGLSTPQGFIASPLHRVVRHCWAGLAEGLQIAKPSKQLLLQATLIRWRMFAMQT